MWQEESVLLSLGAGQGASQGGWGGVEGQWDSVEESPEVKPRVAAGQDLAGTAVGPPEPEVTSAGQEMVVTSSGACDLQGSAVSRGDNFTVPGR